MKYKDIDLDLEKYVFLLNAEEGNPGIYELTWELGHYPLSIEDKYRIAHELLRELVEEGLVIMEKFTDLSLTEKIETIPFERTEEVLNNPYWWYPCNEIISISLTEKGTQYLDNHSNRFQGRLTNRWKENK